MAKDYRITKAGVIVLIVFIAGLVYWAMRNNDHWRPCTPEQTKTLESTYNIKFDDYSNSFSCRVRT